MNRFRASVVTIAALSVGVLATTPAQSKGRDAPQVTVRSSVVIPWHACVTTGKWGTAAPAPGTRVDRAWVVSVRKRGYTFPVSNHKFCGYMGSGTYVLRIKVRWSVVRWRWKRVPVYRYKDVQKFTGEYTPTVWGDKLFPFTCRLDAPTTLSTEYLGGILGAYYDCASDDGSEIDFTVTDSEVNLPNPDWDFSHLSYDGRLILSPKRYNIPFGEVPTTVTGTATDRVVVGGEEPIYTTVSKRYIHHYRKKQVRRWLKRPTFTVKRVVQVIVR
jgi:hypothetical protein